jgi:hypothetical protein
MGWAVRYASEKSAIAVLESNPMAAQKKAVIPLRASVVSHADWHLFAALEFRLYAAIPARSRLKPELQRPISARANYIGPGWIAIFRPSPPL